MTPSGLLPGINKLWGVSSSELYGVGNSGAIIHYQNGQWLKIESGTDLQFLDIYGAEDAKAGGIEILAVMYKKLSARQRCF